MNTRIAAWITTDFARSCGCATRVTASRRTTAKELGTSKDTAEESAIVAFIVPITYSFGNGLVGRDLFTNVLVASLIACLRDILVASLTNGLVDRRGAWLANFTANILVASDLHRTANRLVAILVASFMAMLGHLMASDLAMLLITRFAHCIVAVLITSYGNLLANFVAHGLETSFVTRLAHGVSAILPTGNLLGPSAFFLDHFPASLANGLVASFAFVTVANLLNGFHDGFRHGSIAGMPSFFEHCIINQTVAIARLVLIRSK